MRAERMTWPQCQDYFRTHDTVLLSVGSLECHGRHNPLGTDTLIPRKLLELMEPHTDWLIAPTIPFGACDYFREFPGTISLGEDGLYTVLKKVVDGYYAHGARHFAVLNGHGGNNGVLNRIGYELRDRDALLAELNWWTMVWDMDPRWKGGHGGGEETMAVMAIDPSLVDQSAFDGMHLEKGSLGPEFQQETFMASRYRGVSVAIPRLVTEITDNGWRGPDDPREATARQGQEMLEQCAAYLCDFLKTFQEIPTEKKNLLH